MRPRLLDLYCGGGGAAMGYHRAGFDVVGVDLVPQPDYPFEFVEDDALAVLDRLIVGALDLGEFDAVHASPPCQVFATVTPDRSAHVDLIPATRVRLRATGLPYVIENIEEARGHLLDPAFICASRFGLDMRRHRYFESNVGLVDAPCDHYWQTPRFPSLDARQRRAGRLATVVGVHGEVNYAGEFDLRRRAMGIDWLPNDRLTQAIPPAYTEFIGRQVLDVIRRAG